MKKIILLALTALMVGCDMAMDSLDIVNDSKFIITSKDKEKLNYLYRVVELDNLFYTYRYRDTADFNVGDTLVITIRRLN